MRVFLHVCAFVLCMHKCIIIHICLCAWMLCVLCVMCTRVHVSVCEHAHCVLTCLCVCAPMGVQLCTREYVYTCLYMNVHMLTCMFVFVCM